MSTFVTAGLFVVACSWIMVYPADGVSVLEIKPKVFRNRAGDKQNGDCCDVFCAGTCDPKLTFCLDEVRSYTERDTSVCSIHRSVTREYEETDVITFQGNNILKEMNTWSGSVIFKVLVMDQDVYFHDVLDTFYTKLTVHNRTSYDNKHWYSTTITGRRRSSPTTLEFEYAGYCARGWYGPECDSRQVPTTRAPSTTTTQTTTTTTPKTTTTTPKITTTTTPKTTTTTTPKTTTTTTTPETTDTPTTTSSTKTTSNTPATTTYNTTMTHTTQTTATIITTLNLTTAAISTPTTAVSTTPSTETMETRGSEIHEHDGAHDHDHSHEHGGLQEKQTDGKMFGHLGLYIGIAVGLTVVVMVLVFIVTCRMDTYRRATVAGPVVTSTAQSNGETPSLKCHSEVKTDNGEIKTNTVGQDPMKDNDINAHFYEKLSAEPKSRF